MHDHSRDITVVPEALFTRDGKVYATFTVEDLSDGSRLGRVETLLVDPGARGSGIGEALMNGVIHELRRHGCSSVDAHALPGDRETKNFFESFGLKARLLVVNGTLEDEPQ